MNSNLAYQGDAWEKRREELINGEAVMMSPASVEHTYVADNILMIFKQYLKGKRCVPFGDGVLVHLTEKDKFVPDVMVVCDHSKIKPNGIYGAPDFVAEVLSYSTAKNDRGRKKEVYAKCGVQEYWIVSPIEKSVEVYRTDGAQFILYDIYAQRPDWELEEMTEEDRSALITHFKCSLFEDLDISLDDIFYRTF